MKKINLTIAIIEDKDIKNHNKPIGRIHKHQLLTKIDDDVDIILLEGACKHHPDKYLTDKNELLEDIKKMTSTDKSYFSYLDEANNNHRDDSVTRWFNNDLTNEQRAYYRKNYCTSERIDIDRELLEKLWIKEKLK